jgi:hypothetical protein
MHHLEPCLLLFIPHPHYHFDALEVYIQIQKALFDAFDDKVFESPALFNTLLFTRATAQ